MDLAIGWVKVLWHRESRSLGTNYEIKMCAFEVFKDLFDQNELYHTMWRISKFNKFLLNTNQPCPRPVTFTLFVLVRFVFVFVFAMVRWVYQEQCNRNQYSVQVQGESGHWAVWEKILILEKILQDQPISVKVAELERSGRIINGGSDIVLNYLDVWFDWILQSV